MRTDIDRLFTCEMLPGTARSALVRAGITAQVKAAGCILLLALLLVWSRFAGLAAVWCFVWLVQRKMHSNAPLTFYREFHLRQGHVAPTESVKAPRPEWLPYAISAVLILIPWVPLATLTAASIVLVAIDSHRRRIPRRLEGAIRLHADAYLVYAAYPDDRYGRPGGLWIPRESMKARQRDVSRSLFPTCAALAVAALYAFAGTGFSPGSGLSVSLSVLDVISLLALLPLPSLVLFCMQMVPFAGFIAKLVPVARSMTEWEDAVDLVSNSKVFHGDLHLSDHLFLGFYPPTYEAAEHPFKFVGPFDLPCRSPVLLHRSILEGNVHVLGSAQSGKTSLGIIGLLIQLIRGHGVLQRNRAGRPVVNGHGEHVWNWSERVPTLIIDMKGDLALFNTVRIECEKRGQACHYFSLSKGLATSYFNPITNLNVQDRPVVEFCELVLNALSLFHGLSYGRSYYSKQSRDLLIATLKSLTRKPQSWEELYQTLLTEINPKKHKDVFELVSSIFVLAQFPVLGPAPDGVDVIHMPSVIENCEVCFFSLPARLSAISARDVAKLALFCFVTAAGDWNDRHPERRSFIFLDEAQIICSSNMGTLFQQCSGAKTAMILSNQARSDLNVPDAPMLSETVRVNTRMKQMFTVADPRDALDLMGMSGERLGILRSYSSGMSGGNATSSVSEQEVLHSVLTQNAINVVNNDRTGSLLHIMTGAGYTQPLGIPMHIRTPYPMTHKEYKLRMYTPWPSVPETIRRGAHPVRTVMNKHEPEEVQDLAEQQSARLMEFFQQTARRAGRHRMRDWQEEGD
ncbi:hypothetical protein RAS2_09940 [Phycisphaerae bacterium RAS2]|nr:hypothetical protein RAS2_09940 [Phycisphaerae bacterium RAS2]